MQYDILKKKKKVKAHKGDITLTGAKPFDSRSAWRYTNISSESLYYGIQKIKLLIEGISRMFPIF
jgi:hypothetical protein